MGLSRAIAVMIGAAVLLVGGTGAAVASRRVACDADESLRMSRLPLRMSLAPVPAVEERPVIPPSPVDDRLCLPDSNDVRCRPHVPVPPPSRLAALLMTELCVLVAAPRLPPVVARGLAAWPPARAPLPDGYRRRIERPPRST